MFIAKRAKDKVINDDILNEAQIAQKAKKENKDVINATIGMLFDNEGNIYQFKTITNIIDNLSIAEKIPYNSSKFSLTL